MDELVYIATYAVNVALCLLAFVIARSAFAARYSSTLCSNRFAAAAVMIGIVSGFPLLYGVLWSFEQAGHPVNLAHGEGVIAAPLLNFVIGVAAAGLGRALLRWQSVRW